MDRSNRPKTKKLKQNPVDPVSTLNAEETSGAKNEAQMLALQNRLHATTQLGGKGTVRRRRLRKSALLTQDLSNTEAMRSFLKKFDFNDYGPMETVTFVEDSGKVTSYDSVNLNANAKAGIFHLNFSKYKNASHRKRSSTSSAVRESSVSPAPKPAQHGVRINTTDNLVHKLTTSGNPSQVYELIGSDAFEYLSNFSKKLALSHVQNVVDSEIITADDNDFIPDTLDFDFDSKSTDYKQE